MPQAINPLKIIRIVAWVLVAVIASAFLYLQYAPNAPRGAVIGGPFTMTTMNGEKLDVGVAEKGKPYGVFFGFTQCPDVCPTTMFELSQTFKKMGTAVNNFRVYFVSVDPERDTPQLLKDYLSAFDPRIIGMSGTADEVAAVAKAHRAFYRKVPTPSSYTMDHTAQVYLFDKTGDLFGTLDMQENEDARVKKLTRLLGK